MSKINELEIIKGSSSASVYVFANRWMTSSIYMINLDSGLVVRSWDFSEFLQNQLSLVQSTGERSYDDGNAVLNGIAYREETDTFIVSGKLWDHIYEVRLDY